MSHVPYASIIGSLMYVIVCTRPDLSQTVSMISRYMHDPGRDHWEVVKLILRYIKGTITVDLAFEKDTTGKKECIDMSIPVTRETLTSVGPQRSMFLYLPKHR